MLRGRGLQGQIRFSDWGSMVGFKFTFRNRAPNKPIKPVGPPAGGLAGHFHFANHFTPCRACPPRTRRAAAPAAGQVGGGSGARVCGAAGPPPAGRAPAPRAPGPAPTLHSAACAPGRPRVYTGCWTMCGSRGPLSAAPGQDKGPPTLRPRRARFAQLGEEQRPPPYLCLGRSAGRGVRPGARRRGRPARWGALPCAWDAAPVGAPAAPASPRRASPSAGPPGEAPGVPGRETPRGGSKEPARGSGQSRPF